MGELLYTVGYGGRKPDDLIALLKENEIQCVVDVRRKDSRAYIHTYWSGDPIWTFLNENNIRSWHHYPLGNVYDDLDSYSMWLDTDDGRNEIHSFLYWMIKEPLYRHCLLCSEKDAYKDGKVNCHRVYVADALVKLLGDEWEVKHL